MPQPPNPSDLSVQARTPTIDPDIRRASTLPGSFYRDPDVFERLRERVFARSWHLGPDLPQLRTPGQAYPFTLLEGFLDEPLLLTRDGDDQLHCLSNVCTHRANVVVEAPDKARYLRCRYHGRRFGLDGRCQHMPEFEDVEGFPCAADDLPKVAFGSWGPFTFVSLDPAFPLDDLLAPMRERLSWAPLDQLVFDPSRSRDYLVRAHWALYCDNYLEGFHIPYVHSGLNAVLDYGNYQSELYTWSNLQLGVASEGEEAFDDVEEIDADGAPKPVAAYYYWLFPNLMLNVYPWGISTNVVHPLAVDRTKISFRTYVWDPSRLDRGAGAGLDRVEREDEEIVEQVHRGTGSRLYTAGRYSPKREAGVHHFHRLLAAML